MPVINCPTCLGLKRLYNSAGVNVCGRCHGTGNVGFYEDAPSQPKHSAAKVTERPNVKVKFGNKPKRK